LEQKESLWSEPNIARKGKIILMFMFSLSFPEPKELRAGGHRVGDDEMTA